jgi:hypothetical protein
MGKLVFLEWRVLPGRKVFPKRKVFLVFPMLSLKVSMLK